jgi:hypothetical protein
MAGYQSMKPWPCSGLASGAEFEITVLLSDVEAQPQLCAVTVLFDAFTYVAFIMGSIGAIARFYGIKRLVHP